MIKLFIIYLTYLLSISAHAGSLPSDSQVQDAQINLRLFKQIGDINYMLQASALEHEDRNNESLVMLGGKWRFWDHFKLGTYLGTEQGTRIDDDWVRTNKWKWKDTSSRSQHFFMSELIYRFMPFVLEESILELRLRHKTNLNNGQQTLKSRLAYYQFFRKFIFSLSHEIYNPVNYGEKNVYGRWSYFGFLYRFSNSLRVGPFIGIGENSWTGNDQLKSTLNKTYDVTEKSQIIGLNINFYY